MLPAALTPPPPFGKLAANEIVVQYPAVTASNSDWAAAAPLVALGQASKLPPAEWEWLARLAERR
jgi:hypothetical protein